MPDQGKVWKKRRSVEVISNYILEYKNRIT